MCINAWIFRELKDEFPGLEIRDHDDGVEFTYTKDGDYVGGFFIKDFNRLGSIFLSADNYVRVDMRGKGYGNLFCKIKKRITEIDLCDLIAFVGTYNNIEIHLLEKHGWERIYTLNPYHIYILKPKGI